jgi:hypothetical protein
VRRRDPMGADIAYLPAKVIGEALRRRPRKHLVQVFDANGKWETQWNYLHRRNGMCLGRGHTHGSRLLTRCSTNLTPGNQPLLHTLTSVCGTLCEWSGLQWHVRSWG